LTGWALAVNLN